MSSLQSTVEDAIAAQVLQELSRTPYACSTLTQLNSRPENVVYRGVLQGEDTSRSVIIKHSIHFAANNEVSSVDLMRSIFDEFLFTSVAQFSPSTTGTTAIKAPQIYLYNRETGTQVHEDFTDTAGFKPMLFSAKAEQLIPQSCRAAIGRDLGSWLRSFHAWASAPEQTALRAQILHDDPMRKLKRRLTYDGFLRALENYPEIMESHQKILETIQDVMAKEFEKPVTEKDENWGLLHGDMWSGNILIPATGWQEPPLGDGINKLFIIDWEFAQFGHRSYDIGQLIGDLYERKLYNQNDTGISVIEGIIAGYGEVGDEMAFRIAIHVGVHVIGWYNRRPQRGPWVASPKAIVSGLIVGRDFILNGWEKDRKFFEGTVLASLFTAK